MWAAAVIVAKSLLTRDRQDEADAFCAEHEIEPYHLEDCTARGRYGGRMALALTLTLEARGPAAAFLLTDEQVVTVGEGKKAFPVRVDVNGTSLALRLARMGGENLIGFSKAAREQAGLAIGTAYDVSIAAADAPAAAEVPADLAAALAGDAAAKTAFDALAPSHRKEFGRWIAEAKRDATRADRVAKTLEMLHEGKHR